MSQISGTPGRAWRGASQEMTSEACARGGVVRAAPGRRGGGGRTLAEASAPGQDLGPFLGEFPAASALPASPRPLSGPLLVWSGRRALPAPSRLPLPFVPLPPGCRRLGTGTQSLWTRCPGGHPRRGAQAPAGGEARGAAHRLGTRGDEPAGGPPPGAAPRHPAPRPPQPGLAMAAPRPSPAISVSVSAPAFYAPQKKFGPVVAPKPKVNPFRPGDSEALPAAGAQRAQMGRVGEIPPPPPEGMPAGLGGRTAAGAGLGARASGTWKGCRGGGWAQPPCPEQMFLPHRGARGREPGLLGPVQGPRLGGGRRECGARIFPCGSVFQNVTGAAPLLRRAPGWSCPGLPGHPAPPLSFPLALDPRERS